MQRKKLTEVVMGAFDTWKAETKKSKQVKKASQSKSSNRNTLASGLVYPTRLDIMAAWTPDNASQTPIQASLVCVPHRHLNLPNQHHLFLTSRQRLENLRRRIRYP